MKQIFFILLVFLCIVFTSNAQNNVGINDDNSTPKASAMLDVYSTSKGLLIPRIELTSTTTAAPVTAPDTSLLVYNTATTGDVTPGYYYWNGSDKWVRLVADNDPVKNLNMVTKSSSVTLLKTENMVFATGDITLTLPTVTSVDDGLEITIKNGGTYTDLITIVPQAGKAIDANTSSMLTRWHGRTFIANGSNWNIKEKEMQTDNSLEVSKIGSFTTIAEVVAFLNTHIAGPTVVILGAETYPIDATLTINFPYPVTFQGLSFGETIIVGMAGVSGTPLFDCQTECYFKMLAFTAYSNASGNDGIRFTGSGIYHEVKDCSFSGFNKGIVSTNNHPLLWIFDVSFANCTSAGIEIAEGSASGGSIKVSECLFSQCAKGIHLLSAVAGFVSLNNNTFYNTTSGTDIGILYVPASYTSISSVFISNNSWNNQGTFVSGFDFSRADGRDANIFLTNNTGIVNQNPRCRISVNNNTTISINTTAGTYYKAIWANTTSYTSKWTLDSNKITYQPNNKTDAWAIITGNIIVKDAGRIVTIAIVRNGITGTRYGETNLRVKDGNSPFQFSTVIYIPDIIKNDYMELYFTTNANGDEVTFQDIQWLTNSQ